MRKIQQWLFASVITASALSPALSLAQNASVEGEAKTAEVVSGGKDAIDIAVPAAFKEAKQVVIGSFKVGFINHNKATAKSGGGFLGRDKESRVSLRSKLDGVPPDVMQEIVDDLYANFSAQLKVAGYNVLDRSTLTALPAFTSIAGYPSPYAVNGVSVVPQAQALYFAPTGQNVIEFIGEANRGPGLGGLASIGSQLSASNASITLQEIAEKNKLAILNVHYILNFVNAEGDGGYTRKLTSVSLSQGLTVMPGSSLSIITGYESTFSTKNGNLTLKKAVASGEQFGEFEETTSSLESAAGVFSMVMGGLTGGNSTNSGEYTIKANPQNYRRISLELLKVGSADLVSAMVSLR